MVASCMDMLAHVVHQAGGDCMSVLLKLLLLWRLLSMAE